MAQSYDPDEVFQKLTTTLGNLLREVTGRKIILAEGEVIPEVSGEFILLDLTDSDQMDWEANEWVDEDGRSVVTHNYQVTYTMTAYRGKAFYALTRVLQSMNLPWLYGKYFPENSPFAYASSSTVSRLRVPLNAQAFENRAVMILTFNVCFAIADTTAFEDLEGVNMQVVYKVQSF